MTVSTKALLATACVAALGMTIPAHAYEVAVYNGNMEATNSRMTLEGQNAFVQYGLVNGVPEGDAEGWNKFEEYNRNGGMVYLWNPGDPTLMGQAQQDFEDGLSTNSGVYRRADDGMGGVDADGNAGGTVLYVRTYYNDNHPDQATSLSPADFSGVRDFEAATQILTETFDPTSKYVLTAFTGDIVNTQYYDWTAHRAGTPGVTIDGDDDPYNGYDLQIVAGGIHDHTSPSNARYEHYNYGGEIVASNPGAVTTPNVWVEASTTYLPNPTTQVAMNALAGELIQLRLAALEGPDHSITSDAAFDNVTFQRIVAGDANGNDLVDLNDGGTLVANFGATTGQTWETADFTGDGAVDLNDAGLLVGNFGFGAEPDTAGVAGDAQWTYDAIVAGLSTQITVDAVSMAFLATEALDGATLELLTQAVPFSTGQFGPGALVGEFMTSNFITGSETIQVNVDSAGLYTFNARWNNVGGEEQSQTFQIQFGEVPEPSSLALLGLGSLLMARRRRNA